MSILITQCLQNDFVAPVGKFDPLPNALHIGYKESLRLLGESPAHGPVTTLMKWAKEQEDLEIIHIRDWHDDKDPEQAAHLASFGAHCIQNTPGAAFVFSSYVAIEKAHVIDASGLNDFYKTKLEKQLNQFGKEPKKAGLIGVWTEAKISFLAYELKTRYPNFDVAVCSALCASSSTAKHFLALDHLKNILGVKVFDSVGDFTAFLNGKMPALPAEVNERLSSAKFSFDHDSLMESDKRLLSYLFRDAKEVNFKVLDGGFSGNVVMKAAAFDIHGHKQVPTVIKIGKRSLISKERTSFERIQEILGNNAPAIVDFAEDNERGAIKYRYASMLDEKVISFQKLYESGAPLEKIFSVLDTVFVKQLGRLYKAAKSEKLDLLKYYDFNPKYASSVRKKVESLTGAAAIGDTLMLEGKQISNVCIFYEQFLNEEGEYVAQEHYMSFVHGDLNGANMMIDAQENVWIIDFFHTHYGHVLRDLIKLENDLLFIFTKINSAPEFEEACLLLDALADHGDLGDLPPEMKFNHPQLQRTYLTLRHLRSFYTDLIHTDKIPYQYHLAMLRYAMHTLSFDECNEWQKKLALYFGSKLSGKIIHHLKGTKKLRIDFILTNEKSIVANNQIALTILPGRKDRNRNLQEDLNTIKENGIRKILCLLSENEFVEYGVPELKSEYEKYSFEVFYLKILDQGVPTHEALNIALDKVKNWTDQQEKVLFHCVGGLGRSGLAAACFHKKFSRLSPDDAISLIRKCRSQRAVENEIQEKFVETF